MVVKEENNDDVKIIKIIFRIEVDKFVYISFTSTVDPYCEL